jgi:hypothetical protein
VVLLQNINIIFALEVIAVCCSPALGTDTNILVVIMMTTFVQQQQGCYIRKAAA